MITCDRIIYNLVYAEQIHRYLCGFGLTSGEADFFLYNASKEKDLPSLREKFGGNDAQWDLLRDAAKGAVHASHAVANFLTVK